MRNQGRVSAGQIEVVFEHREDRIAHAIRIGNGPTARPILSSLEGQDEQLWPSSPPLQQLHIEDRPGGIQVAMLVGMAGSSHWSLSCAADPHTQTLTFDVAARIKSAPQHLGSLYDIASGVSWDPQTHLVDGRYEICCDRSNSRFDLERAITITPLDLPVETPVTVQWRYTIACVDTEAIPVKAQTVER